VSNFAACLGEKCKGEDQAGIEGAMATMFAKNDERLKGTGKIRWLHCFLWYWQSYHRAVCCNYRSFLGRSLSGISRKKEPYLS